MNDYILLITVIQVTFALQTHKRLCSNLHQVRAGGMLSDVFRSKPGICYTLEYMVHSRFRHIRSAIYLFLRSAGSKINSSMKVT